MIKFYISMIYDIADLRINIENKLPFTARFCEGYLSPDQESEPAFSVKVTNEQFFKEKEVSDKFSDGYIENICLYRNICNLMPYYDRFLLHSSVVEYDGKCYAFLGHSGAGKSTHSRLWLKYLENAKILNGDKPIVRESEEGYIAYGTPWMGKEGLGYKGKGKIYAICFIEQALKNEIIPLSASLTADRLFSQILLPDDAESVMKTMTMADNFIKRVPSFVLKCDISEEAFRTSFDVLTRC